jgi:hypothetical protein
MWMGLGLVFERRTKGLGNKVSFFTTLDRPATGRSSSQLCGRPHPLLSQIHGLHNLKWLLLQGYASGLISQRKSPGVGNQGLGGGN